MKQILLLIISILFISCSESINDYENGEYLFSDTFENNKPEFLTGEYGVKSSQIQTEQGTITFTKEFVIVRTENHYQSFKISESFNYYSEGCVWVIRVNDINYEFTTNSLGEYVWFKYKRDSDKYYIPIGTYYKDYKEEQPIINN